MTEQEFRAMLESGLSIEDIERKLNKELEASENRIKKLEEEVKRVKERTVKKNNELNAFIKFKELSLKIEKNNERERELKTELENTLATEKIIDSKLEGLKLTPAGDNKIEERIDNGYSMPTEEIEERVDNGFKKPEEPAADWFGDNDLKPKEKEKNLTASQKKYASVMEQVDAATADEMRLYWDSDDVLEVDDVANERQIGIPDAVTAVKLGVPRQNSKIDFDI